MTTSYRRRQKLKKRFGFDKRGFRSEVASTVRKQLGQPVRLSDLLAAKSP